MLNSIANVSGYNISNCHAFIKNNVLLEHISSVFEYLIQTITSFTLFGSDLLDEVALEFVKSIPETERKEVKYFLLSETKVITNFVPGSSLLVNDFHQYSSAVFNELTGMCFRSFSVLQNMFEHFKCLDLSMHEFSLNYATLLVDSLQYCCIEKVILLDYNGILKAIKELIFDTCLKGKKIQNTNVQVPLEVVGIAGIYMNVTADCKIHLYLVGIFNADVILENKTVEDKYDELQYISLNSLQNTCAIPSKFLSNISERSSKTLFISNFELPEDMILRVAEQLKPLSKQVQYLLASKTVLLALRVGIELIIKALAYNPLITTIKLTECLISTVDFTLMVAKRLEQSRIYSFEQCSILPIQNFMHNSILHNLSMIPNLLQLDISLSTFTSSCVGMILAALQSCIIRKIIISDNNTNHELVFGIFLNANGKDHIINFIKGIPLVIINKIQRRKSSTHMCSCTVFLMNTELNGVIHLITDVSNYNIYDYKLLLMGNNILKANLNNALLSQFNCLLPQLTNLTLFGSDLMHKVAWKIVQHLDDISNCNAEYSLICDKTSLTNFQPLLGALCKGGLCNLKEVLSVFPLALRNNLEFVDISNCSINNEQFSTFLNFLSQTLCVEINILNVSHNKLSPISLVKAIMQFHVKKLYLYGEFYKIQETLTTLLTNIMDLNHNLELIFSESIAVVLCDMQFDTTDLINKVMSSNSLLRLFIVNCNVEKQASFIDVMKPALDSIPLSIISSIHLYNNSLKPEDIIKVVDYVVKVDLFIEEYDYKFERVQSDCQFSKDIVYFASILFRRAQILWTLPEMTNLKNISFHFNDLL